MPFQGLIFASCSFCLSEENSLVAMLRFQEFERSTVDTEGAMGLAAILAGHLPELRGKKWVRLVKTAGAPLCSCFSSLEPPHAAGLSWW